mgnify:FL=1
MGKKPGTGGRKRDPAVRRQACAAVRLVKHGLPVVEVDEASGRPVGDGRIEFIDGLSRRKAEEAVAFFEVHPAVVPEWIATVVEPGRPGRPTVVRTLPSEQRGFDDCQQRVPLDAADPLAVLVDREEAAFSPEDADVPDEPDRDSDAERLRRKKATVRANVRNVRSRPNGFKGPLYPDVPPCRCADFWEVWLERRRVVPPFLLGVVKAYEPGTHEPCSRCGLRGEGYYRKGQLAYCAKCYAIVEPPPPHRHCDICRAAALERDPAVQPFAWVHPVTMEREVIGWYCPACRAKLRPPPPSWRKG